MLGHELHCVWDGRELSEDRAAQGGNYLLRRVQKAIRQLSAQDSRTGKVSPLWYGKTAKLEIRPCAHGAHWHL